MTFITRLFPLLLVAPLSLSAQAGDTSITVDVTLDHPDWRYSVGDSARFTISIRRGGSPARDSRTIIDLAQERMRPVRRDTVRLDGNSYKLAGTLKEPGFLRVTATSVIDGVAYRGMATAAFDPERLEPSVTMPADFEQFWKDAIEKGRRIPLLPAMTLLPERSTHDVNVYHINFQNYSTGSRMYGILSMPKAAGKYPAVLGVPGAGVRPYFPEIETARSGVISLKLGIHGIPVTYDSLVYNQLRATALARYYTYGLEDRDLYYYKRVIVGVVRAGDFIFQLPQFDGVNYAVRGGSQGGGLAIIAGALDPRVKGIAVSYPAMSDQLGFLNARAGGWPHVFSDTTPVKARPEKLETIRYYDVINFARLLRIPGIYTWGFNDTTVPPTASYVTYNVIQAPKEFVIVPETGHQNVPSQEKRIREWVMRLLGRLP